jgi:CDP-paratose 2-epimerase
MNILILGGAGFVGSSLAILLKRQFPNFNIQCLDNLRRRGSELNISILRNEGVIFRHGDVRLMSDLEIDGVIDLVVECSAEPSVLAGVDGSARYVLDTNLNGTINCLEFCRRKNAKLIFISSSRVYPISALNSVQYTENEFRYELGDNQDSIGVTKLGISEQFNLLGVRSLYGVTKYSAELLIAEYESLFGVKFIINRCGLIAGPGQFGKTDQGVVTHWVLSHLWKIPLHYFGYQGTGKQVRDVLHIEDLFQLIKVQIIDFYKFNGRIYNIGGGHFSTSLKELTSLCQRITGNCTEISCDPSERYGDIRIYITDNSKINNDCGWKPKKNLEATVEDIFKWCTKNETLLRKAIQ